MSEVREIVKVHKHVARRIGFSLWRCAKCGTDVYTSAKGRQTTCPTCKAVSEGECRGAMSRVEHYPRTPFE